MPDKPPSIKQVFGVIKNIFEGVGKIFKGIGEEFIDVGEGTVVGVIDITTLFKFTFIFLGTYIGCAVYFLTNIRGCLVYYLVEVFGQILYIPVRITVWIFSLFSLNLQKPLDTFWDNMESLDQVVYKYVGFHIIHYPRNVRQKCYVCKRLKMKVMSRQAGVVKDDFSPGGRIEQILMGGINTIKDGAYQLTHPLD